MLQTGSEGRGHRRNTLIVRRWGHGSAGELHQGQGITGRLAQNARAKDRVQLGCSLIEQHGRGRTAKPLQVEGRQVCILEWRRMPSADGSHQRHWLAVEPARDERQRAHGRLVEPLCVVDDQHHWARVRGVTHKLKDRERDSKRIRLAIERTRINLETNPNFDAGQAGTDTRVSVIAASSVADQRVAIGTAPVIRQSPGAASCACVPGRAAPRPSDACRSLFEGDRRWSVLGGRATAGHFPAGHCHRGADRSRPWVLLPVNAAALICAGVLSTLFFPAGALAILRRLES